MLTGTGIHVVMLGCGREVRSICRWYIYCLLFVVYFYYLLFIDVDVDVDVDVDESLVACLCWVL